MKAWKVLKKSPKSVRSISEILQNCKKHLQKETEGKQTLSESEKKVEISYD